MRLRAPPALRRARRGGNVTTACAGQQFVHGFILPKDSRTAQGKTGNWTRETADRHGTLAVLRNPKAFAAWLRPLFRSPWVVYCKRPFGGAQHALRYLGQYTHRVAISNHRLVSLTDGLVTFRWRDSAHHNKKRLMTLPVNEFLRRFLLHVLPPGFVRIRYFGWMAHRCRGASLPFCLQLLAPPGRVPPAVWSLRKKPIAHHDYSGLVPNAVGR